jgi:signal transduction histidine kinase
MERVQTSSLTVEELQHQVWLRERQIKAIHNITAALFTQGDIDDLLRECLLVLLDAVNADAGSILIYDVERSVLVFRHAVGPAGAQLVGVEVDAEDHRGKAATVFRTGESLITHSTLADAHDARMDTRTGYRTESMLTVPLKDLDGAVIGVLQAINKRDAPFNSDDRDLLEIVSALAAATIVNARLADEAKLAAVARAVGDLGHDIKNALTPIETMVDTTVEAFVKPMFDDLDRLRDGVAAEQPDLALQVDAAVQPLRDWIPEVQGSVADGCADIREMVSEIADYVKGAQSTHIVPNDIGEVVEERLKRLRSIARDRRVTIHTDIQPDIRPFPFDRRLIGRAVFNLVNNALVAISDAVKKKSLELRSDGFHIWVTVTEQTTREAGRTFCRIEVRDDGPGIPAKVKDSLFTALAISTTPGGTGIGTRFVKSVADAHQGTVGVESELGEGARFWIELPMSHAQAI